MKKFIKASMPLVDIFLLPFIYLAAYLLKLLRLAGIWRMPFCKNTLMRVGVFPIRNHYYEPFFDYRQLRYPLDKDRDLPGIDWNIDEQLLFLKNLCFSEELKTVPKAKVDDLTFYMDNGTFMSGDAEYLYNLIRFKKPKKIFEIGSGNSTLMAIKAIKKNQEENIDYQCKHLCIEPYEIPWLEKTGATIVRERVEEVNKALFAELEKDDILFIDSSHMIRPQGDVLFEYLELIPTLKTGVIVHVHDIFSPKDYLNEWVVENVRFWNEQYLLEAFLTCNRDWKIIGALNYLHHNYSENLLAVCPFLVTNREPGSFYIQKIS